MPSPTATPRPASHGTPPPAAGTSHRHAGSANVDFTSLAKGETVTIEFPNSNLAKPASPFPTAQLKAKVTLQFDRALSSAEQEKVREAVRAMSLVQRSGSVNRNSQATLISEIRRSFGPGSDLGISVAKWSEGIAVENLLMKDEHLGMNQSKGSLRNVVAEEVRLDGGVGHEMNLDGTTVDARSAVKFSGRNITMSNGSVLSGVTQLADFKGLIVDSSSRITSDIRGSDFTDLTIRIGDKDYKVAEVLGRKNKLKSIYTLGHSDKERKDVEKALLKIFTGAIYDDSTKFDPEVKAFFDDKRNSKEVEPTRGVGFADSPEMLFSLRDNPSFRGVPSYDAKHQIEWVKMNLPGYGEEDGLGIGKKSEEFNDGLQIHLSPQLRRFLGSQSSRYVSGVLSSLQISEVYGALADVARQVHPHTSETTNQVALNKALKEALKYFKPVDEKEDGPPVAPKSGPRIIGSTDQDPQAKGPRRGDNGEVVEGEWVPVEASDAQSRIDKWKIFQATRTNFLSTLSARELALKAAESPAVPSIVSAPVDTSVDAQVGAKPALGQLDQPGAPKAFGGVSEDDIQNWNNWKAARASDLSEAKAQHAAELEAKAKAAAQPTSAERRYNKAKQYAERDLPLVRDMYIGLTGDTASGHLATIEKVGIATPSEAAALGISPGNFYMIGTAREAGTGAMTEVTWNLIGKALSHGREFRISHFHDPAEQ